MTKKSILLKTGELILLVVSFLLVFGPMMSLFLWSVAQKMVLAEFPSPGNHLRLLAAGPRAQDEPCHRSGEYRPGLLSQPRNSAGHRGDRNGPGHPCRVCPREI